MSEYRESFIFLATGTRGVGKTYQTKREIESYVMNDPKLGRRGRKVLIFDTNGEADYKQYKSVYFDVRPCMNKEDISVGEAESAKYIKQLTAIEIRRVTKYRPDGEEMSLDEKMKTAAVLMRNYKTGLLLLEDINNYVVGMQSKDFISSLTTNRHKNQDIIIHLQSLSAIPPRLWQNLDVIRIHHQADPFFKIKEKCNNFEILAIIEVLINMQYHSGNKYFFVYFYNHRNKFKIPFGNEKERINMFNEACEAYVLKNPTVKNEIMKEITLSGKKKYGSLQEGIKDFTNKKREQYLM